MDLVLKNPIISSGLGFRRREDTTSSQSDISSKSSTKLIQDLYSATFGWHPSELPSLDVYYQRRYFYDSNRTSLNVQTDNYTWTSNYQAIKGLEVNYNGNYSQVQDKINVSETESLVNSGRIAYTGISMNNRVFYNTSYNLSMQNTSITPGKTGPLLSPQIALNQLFLLTPDKIDPNITVTNGKLNNGNLSTQNINLVLPQPNPNPQQNNIGLQFFTKTDVDTLFLSVTSKAASPPIGSLNKIADQFATQWEIYTSSDNLTWTQFTPGFTVVAGTNPDPLNPGTDDVGFKFNLQAPLTTQYIKIVETPFRLDNTPLLSTSDNNIDPNSILVKNLQGFKTILVTNPGKPIKSSNISGIYDMNLKALLLDDPNLSYDFTFNLTHNKSDQSALTSTYLINNGLNFAQKYREIWSVNARISDELNSDSDSKLRNTITYNAGVSVTPIPTLNHSLVYGGRFELFKGKTTMTNSIYLNNSAEFYRGLSVNLGAGYSKSRFETGQNSDSISITFGTEVVPNRNLTFSLSYQDNMGYQSGGGQPNKSSFNRTATTTATYRPFDAIYLTGGYSIFLQNDKKSVTLQNYGVSWSPFRGGDLQFNFAYSESYDSGQDEKTNNISPSLRWNVRPGSTFDVSYNILDSKSSITGTTKANSLGAQLRITF